MNTKLFLTAIAIVATFSIAVTAITTNVSAQNMTEGNMTGGNMTGGNATVGNASGSISAECGPYRTSRYGTATTHFFILISIDLDFILQQYLYRNIRFTQ